MALTELQIFLLEKAVDLTLTYLASLLKSSESGNGYYDCTYDRLISIANDYLKGININEISSKDIHIIRMALTHLESAYAHNPNNDLIVVIIRIHYALNDGQKIINDWANRLTSGWWHPCEELKEYISSEQYQALLTDYYDTKRECERINKEIEEHCQQVKDDWDFFNATYPGFP